MSRRNPVIAKGASKLEMDKIAGWMAREGVQADVEPVNGHWGITVPSRVAARARAAFQRVLRNPKGKGLPIPKGAIELVVDKLHVGMPAAEVRAIVRERIEQAMKKGARGWTAAKIRQAEEYGVKRHRKNLRLYRDVMGGGLGRGKAKNNRGGRWYYAIVSRRGLWGPFATRQRAGATFARLRRADELGLTIERVRRDGRDFIFKSGGRFRTARPGERVR